VLGLTVLDWQTGRIHRPTSLRAPGGGPMSRDAFLADIIANPDDDDLRLVYADWLEDHGQPERAEFIRLQIEVARRTGGEDSRWLIWKKRPREKELLEKHGKAWIEEQPPWARDAPAFWRGLVYSVLAKAEAFVAGAAWLMRAVPVERLALM